MGLATAVREFQLADSLFALPSKARDDVFGELAQVVRGIGEGKELSGVLVDRFCRAHSDVVKIGGEDLERKLAGLEVWPQVQHFVPWCPGKFSHRILYAKNATIGASLFVRQKFLELCNTNLRVTNKSPKKAGLEGPMIGVW